MDIFFSFVAKIYFKILYNTYLTHKPTYYSKISIEKIPSNRGTVFVTIMLLTTEFNLTNDTAMWRENEIYNIYVSILLSGY